MAYSRWSNSRWYTYWRASGGRTRDTQLFDICSIKIFSYKELRTNLEQCLQKVQELVPDTTKEEIQELEEYIQCFLNDIESEKKLVYYENLQDGYIHNIEEFLKWFQLCDYDKSLKEEINEALTVLCSDDLPLLVGTLKGNLGKLLLEKRFKGIVTKQIWPNNIIKRGT